MALYIKYGTSFFDLIYLENQKRYSYPYGLTDTTLTSVRDCGLNSHKYSEKYNSELIIL